MAIVLAQWPVSVFATSSDTVGMVRSARIEREREREKPPVNGSNRLAVAQTIDSPDVSLKKATFFAWRAQVLFTTLTRSSWYLEHVLTANVTFDASSTPYENIWKTLKR